MSQHYGLMTEEEVRQYFILNGGVVRNNDIVTYFRNYLANPSIRDEARAVFKTIVNKLATVKVENGEKYLVLKRQYFLPIDGNGNSSGLPPVPVPSQPYAYGGYGPSPTASYPGPAQGSYQTPGHGLPPPPSVHSPQQSFTPFPYQAPPPYISSGAYPNVQPPSAMPPAHQPSVPPYQHHQQMSKSQPQLYGSHFSLNSTAYGDTYASQASPYSSPMALGPGGDDYGLPPAPPISQNKNVLPPRRLSFSSSSSSSSIASPGGSRMIPPPYRPPPPAPAYISPPPPAPSSGIRLPVFRSPGSVPGYGGSPGRTEPLPAFPYQRSFSVSGTPSPVAVGLYKGSQSASPSKENQPFFPTDGSPASQLQSPPPPVPPRAKRSASFLEKSPPLRSAGARAMMEELRATEPDPSPNDKENTSPPGGILQQDDESPVFRPESALENGPSEAEQKISVRERMEKFNKIASDSDLLALKVPNGNGRSKRENGSKHDSGDYDTSSLSSYGYAQTEPKAREWILKAARTDYAGVNKMAQETPILVKLKDINTALHWAAKHGHVDLVKLLAGTYRSDVNSKSNGGYTPLHLAAQFSRQDVYDILVTVYNADPNVRDYSGRKPMQYFVRQDTAVSVDTFKKLKEKRRSTEQQRERDSNSFLRIGSLNVRVKKTTEAFGNFIGKSNSASNIERLIHKKWGSADSLPEAETTEKDKEMMPPPTSSSSTSKGRRSKARKSVQNGFQPPASPTQQRLTVPNHSAETSRPRSQEMNSGSDSDTACGFGSDWKG